MCSVYVFGVCVYSVYVCMSIWYVYTYLSVCIYALVYMCVYVGEVWCVCLCIYMCVVCVYVCVHAWCVCIYVWCGVCTCVWCGLVLVIPYPPALPWVNPTSPRPLSRADGGCATGPSTLGYFCSSLGLLGSKQAGGAKCPGPVRGGKVGHRGAGGTRRRHFLPRPPDRWLLMCDRRWSSGLSVLAAAGPGVGWRLTEQAPEAFTDPTVLLPELGFLVQMSGQELSLEAFLTAQIKSSLIQPSGKLPGAPGNSSPEWYSQDPL